MKLHIVTDLTTQTTLVQGATRRYTVEEYEAARRDAPRGDANAIAILDDIRAAGARPIEHLLDDCPECQAARARGEAPETHVFPAAPRRWSKRPRWRTMKRSVR